MKYFSLVYFLLIPFIYCEFENKNNIRKLEVIVGQNFYQLQNSSGNLIYEFTEPVTQNLILNLTVIGETGIETVLNVSNRFNDYKRAIFRFNDSNLTEGFYNVSFYDNDTLLNDEIITLLIFKNKLLVGDRKKSYELIDINFTQNFDLEINLQEPIFKEQIYKIEYKKIFYNELISDSIEISDYSLSEDKTSLILTLDKEIKKEFRNLTFYIYDKKDEKTDDSTLSFTLIVTNFIVLNPIIFFMESSLESQSLKDVTFQIKFANNVTYDNLSDIRIYIDGYKQLNGTETFNNTSKNANLTFTKNTTQAKEYFIEYNGSGYPEYRNIYLANYTMSGGCQLLPSQEDIFIDISYTNNLQGIVDIYFINKDNDKIRFHRFTNTTVNEKNLITYTYQLNNLYIIDEGQFNLMANSNILYLEDNYIDKDSLKNISF